MNAPFRPPRVGFSTAKTWNPISMLIRWITSCPASHCYFVFWDETLDTEMVIEAHWTFQAVPYNNWRKKNKVVAEFTAVHTTAMLFAIRHTLKFLGTHYDVSGLLGMTYVLAAWAWFHRKVRNPLQNPKALFCSEAVTAGLRAAKSMIVRSLPAAGSTSPEELYHACCMAVALHPSEVQRYSFEVNPICL